MARIILHIHVTHPSGCAGDAHSNRVELVIEHEDVDGIDVAQERVVWIETKDDKEYRYTKEHQWLAQI